jgi:hypothetical protein
MTPHGDLTAKLAGKISPYWNGRGYDVFYDHGSSSKNVGKIVSTINKEYHNGDELSQLDIAIVKQDSNQIAILVEIEETTDKPKTFLGDIFGVLFGEYIFFKRNELVVGGSTTLVVLGVNITDHEARNKYIQNQVNKVKASLGTRNAGIGKVKVMSYKDGETLIEQLPLLLEKAAQGES